MNLTFLTIVIVLSLLIACTHNRFDAAADVEVTDDFCLPRLARFNKILQHLVHDMLMEDADISVEEEVLLQRLQFDAVLVRDIGNTDCGEIG